MFGAIPDYQIEQLNIISPFDKSKLQPFGYDVSITEGEIWKLKHTYTLPLSPNNPPPKEAWEIYNLKNKDIILVQWGELWLAKTSEYFKLPNNIQMLLLNKSRFARCGAMPNIGVAPADAGWQGYLVLELCSLARQGVEYTIGEPVAQVMFIGGSPCAKPYDSTHIYQNQDTIRGPLCKENLK